MGENPASRDTLLRVGQAAEMLQVSVDTLRRWEAEGRLRTERSAGGQRMVPVTEVTRLFKRSPQDASSARRRAIP
jgi:excisionase family DNA binding protein